MKHGPNALIDETLPVVVLVTRDEHDPASRLRYEKTLSNIQEVTARSGRVIAVATEGDTIIGGLVEQVIFIPPAIEMLSPLIEIVPLQLLAVLRRRAPRLRRRPAEKPRQIRHRGVSCEPLRLRYRSHGTGLADPRFGLEATGANKTPTYSAAFTRFSIPGNRVERTSALGLAISSRAAACFALQSAGAFLPVLRNCSASCPIAASCAAFCTRHGFLQPRRSFHLLARFGNRFPQLPEPRDQRGPVSSISGGVSLQPLEGRFKPVARGRVGAQGIHKAVERGELVSVLRGGPLAETHRLQHGCHGAQRIDLNCACQIPQPRVAGLKMRQCQPFQLDGRKFKTPVHVVHVPHILRGPEALGNRGGPRPDPRINRARIKVLAPHADFATENPVPFLGAQVRR